MIQLELETSLGKALIEEKGYSLLKINNAAENVSKPALWGRLSKSYSALHFFLREITLNTKMCLNYESLRLPETSIFKWSGYTDSISLHFGGFSHAIHWLVNH